jgi:hypothetical protein
MESPKDAVASLIEQAEEYGKTTFELYRLKLVDSVTELVSVVTSKLSVLIVLLVFVLMLSVGLALFLGEVLGKTYYGFFIVSGFYLLVGIVLHVFMDKWIRAPISESILNSIQKDTTWQN